MGEGVVVAGQVEVIGYPGAVGLAVVRAAASVLHRQGETKRIDAAWVDAHVRIDRQHVTEEE